MAFNNLVDITRLQYFLEKLKALIPSTYASSKSASGYADKALSVPIATVDSTSTATAFTVQVAEFANETGPRDGMFFYIRNNKVASASGWTLNVNGWGGKPVYNASAERTTTGFALNRIFPCWYDSTLATDGCWVIGYLTDANTTYSTFRNIDHGNGAGRIAHSVVYRYQILFEKDSDYVTPLNNVSNGYNNTKKAMLTDVEFDPFGEIFYWYSSETVAKDARVRGDYLNYIYGSLDLRYTFNCGTTLTAYKPFYLVVDIGTNGKAKIASSTPWAQELPSTNDGHYYIFLGRTYSAYQLSLYPWHPVYYHDGTSIRQYLPVDAKSVNGHTVGTDVPANAVFTDTTYESKAAASGGTAISLVTTGEKYTWNSKQAALVSGTNIKTINGSSLLGSGNLAVSGLPAVTSSDNDKVLKVVSGAWAAADNNGGTMTISISGFPPNTTTDKTFSEAYTAYQNGSMLFANWNGNFYRLSGVSSTSLSFTNVSVTNDVGVGSSTLTYSSSGAISLSSAGVVKSTPLIIPLLCDDSSDYMDPPSGTLSIEYSNDIVDISSESTQREVILVNGYVPYDQYGTYSSDKYSIVSTVFTPGASGDPDTLTIIFRCLGSRNGTPIIKTINLSGEVYSGVIAVSYSEEPAGSGSMPVNAAVIHVNAPLGSAITFFKDSTVMEAVTAAQTHPNADGKTEDYYYSVPTSDFGSWTVAASKSGENDAAQSFSVLVAKQYDAILSYLAPYDFQAVEWIQTSTAVYFDTGIIPTTTNYTTKVSLQVAVADGGYIFNVEGGYGMSQVGGYEQLRYNYVSGNTTINMPGIRTVGTDFDIIYNNDSGVVMVNGVEVSANPNIRALDNRRYSILVAAARYGANVSYYGIWRYKRFTVLERDTKNVLIDMHPCYRKMDNMPGFWDSVSNTFMTQLGTGTITVGPDV